MDNNFKHVAFIMDGNGRWATSHGLKRLEGHKKGVETVEWVIKSAPDLGFETLTFYAFSSENWKRPEDEIKGLMGLLKLYFSNKIDEMVEKNICLKVFGDKNINGKLSSDVLDIINKVEKSTKHCTGLKVNFCINYGGRDEIIRAAQDFADDVEKGTRYVGDLDEELFASYLDSNRQTYPDLVIRTGGDKRISNFLLWQIAYSEIEFSNISWPDFNLNDLKDILFKYKNIERRFGGIK